MALWKAPEILVLHLKRFEYRNVLVGAGLPERSVLYVSACLCMCLRVPACVCVCLRVSACVYMRLRVSACVCTCAELVCIPV